ncbi:hypothetical protein D0B54_14740 [Solimonas sp. K1W22B-7]|uniref:Kelch repeat-containing protein n=1 Tax=Solimonas sp. K1W22B-7 TaxID=2303331 RepID=UPI000E32EBEB|nr:kelch repeat-containing protein [Solimonas sp. K1W22B-7]AXQ29855.1 hypothetical protein D0B54_14740 [Solimonas sp. K1W22B-7]
MKPARISGLALLLLLTACGNSSDPAGGPAEPRYDNAAGRWEQLPPSPLKRLEAFGTRVGRHIYIIGGYEEQRLGAFGFGLPLEVEPIPGAKVERYNLDSGAWDFAKPMPLHLDHARAVEYQGKLYVTGGNAAVALALPLFWEYDPATDAWTSMPPMPQPAAGHTAVVLGDQLVVAGGYIFPVNFPSVQLFDFGTRRWSRGPNLPVMPDHAQAVALDGYMYVIGGRPNDVMQGLAYKQVQRWKPGMDAWESVAELTYTRAGGGAAVACGRIVVVSGEDPHQEPREVRPQTEVYDPTRNLWSRLPDIPTPRHGVIVVSDGADIYAIEGGDMEILGVSNAVERLRLDCAAVAALPAAEPEDAPEGLCVPDIVPAAGGHCGGDYDPAQPGTPETLIPQLAELERLFFALIDRGRDGGGP